MKKQNFSTFLLRLSPDKVYEAIEREAIIEYDGKVTKEEAEKMTVNLFTNGNK